MRLGCSTECLVRVEERKSYKRGKKYCKSLLTTSRDGLRYFFCDFFFFFLIFNILMSALTLRHLLLSTIWILSWPALVTWMNPTSSPLPSLHSKCRIGELPGQGCQNGPKRLWGFCHVNTIKCFVWATVLNCKKTNRAARRWKLLLKKLCATWQNPRFLKYCSSPWPGVSLILHFKRGEGPGDEVSKRPSFWSSKIERTMSVR